MHRYIQTYFLAVIAVALFVLFPVKTNAQLIDFSAQVTFHYEGKELSKVLDDISKKYDVGFSYSRQIIPVRQRIYLHVDKMAFGDAIEMLFAQTQVVYGIIGDQIVLSIDVNKIPEQPDLSYLNDGMDDSLAATGKPAFEERMQYHITPLNGYQPTFSYTTDTRITPEEVAYDLETQLRRAERKSMMRAQVSVVPGLKADTDPYDLVPVNLSFNVLAGVTDSVAGIELGGLVNVTKESFRGFQAAGLVNTVGGDFEGFQAAGLVNVTGDRGRGFQAAGLFNFAHGEMHAQAAGLANFARGTTNGQAAGLFNIAKDVEGAQIAGLFNVAKNVKGVQIGVLNFADSVGSMPIGIVSIVRKRGYHSLEFGVEDAIDYNMNLRLGVRAFYNILHVGIDEEGENWSLGYGLGTSIWLAGRNYLQFEVMARQINEGETWTNALNLLSQVKMTYDFALARNIRVALGPSFNIATSRRFNPETGEYGTDVPRYVMFENTYDDGYRTPLNVKYWVGLHAGIRFGSAEFIPQRQRGGRVIYD